MEKESWEEEFDEKFKRFCDCPDCAFLTPPQQFLDIKNFIRTQREQAITDYLKGEGAQQYIAEIKEQARREGVEAALELVPEDSWLLVESRVPGEIYTSQTTHNLRDHIRSKLLNN